VAILGSGFGGLEAAYLLAMRLGDRADLTLVSDEPRFLFKPNTIYVPFGLDPERLRVDIAGPARRRGITFLDGHVREIDPERRRVRGGGLRLSYDFLVLATGATTRPEDVPGLAQHGHTIWTVEDLLRLRGAFARLAEATGSGERRRVLFLVPPGNRCSGPLYEIVFMLDTWLRRRGAREGADLTWTTYETGYVQAFGPRLDTMVQAEFARRGITGHRGYVVDHVEPGRVVFADDQRLGYDLLVSFPPYAAATTYAGLEADDRGFLATDEASRRLPGHPEVYAVGDTADFPVKQAFLALLQADVAAELIAAEVMGKSTEARFDPTSMCVMEQLDTAIFAQVPLRATGRPEAPVEVRQELVRRYRVGMSPAWRLGKRLLGWYLPWRFQSGRPFHAGAPWTGMELGLNVMSRLLAA
jgi:sulfide:quinone oxidoreductase